MARLVNVEKTLGRERDGLVSYENTRVLMSEVRVYDKNGKLKKTITPKQLLKRLYKNEGISTAPFPSVVSETKYGEGKCLTCKTVFNKTHKEQKFCKTQASTIHAQNKCYNEYYKFKTRRKKIDIECKTCKTIFKGSKGRVYCNNPCDHNRYEKYDLPETDECTMCGKTFKPKQKQSRFCGKPCNFEIERNEIRRVKRLWKDIEGRKKIIDELTAENEDLSQMLCSLQKSREGKQDSKLTVTMCG